MPTFKPKAIKKIKINRKSTITLDGKHKEFLNEFAKDEFDTIPSLQEEKYELKQMLESNNGELSLEETMDIRDRIIEINELIKELKKKKLNYFLDNSPIIFEYFENKKNISTTTPSSNTAPEPKNVTTKSQMLDNFFKLKQQPTTTTTEAPPPNPNEINNHNIVQKYLTNIDESFLDINNFVKPTDVCQSCYKGELIPLDDEGVLICNMCAVNIPYLIENEKPSYKEPPKEVSFYAYKKINHFKEIMAQFQGKETTFIPDDVIETIKQQIKKERIGLEQLTYHKTKEILKKLCYNRYYEHIAFIKNKLGITPPIMSPALEETLCNLFMELQSPYAKHCPDYRVNFLNYYYVMYKLCELLDEHQYLDSIPMLKNREKLIEQDKIWKKMCEELDWEFIPTV